MKLKSSISATEIIADKEISLNIDPINGTIIASYNYQETGTTLVNNVPMPGIGSTLQVTKRKDGTCVTSFQNVVNISELYEIEQIIRTWLTENGETVLNILLYNNQIDSTLQVDLLKLKQTFVDWIKSDKSAIYCDYDKDFPFELAPSIYFSFIILINIDLFFNNMKIVLSKIVTLDDKILDLLSYVKNRLLDISYRPGRTFTINYDWIEYSNTGVLNYSPATYQLNDTQVLTGGRWFDIDWMQHENNVNEYLMQYIYRVCYDWKSSKLSKNIVKVDFIE
jgi:hypothetical protein